jgi:hypothetical protein
MKSADTPGFQICFGSVVETISGYLGANFSSAQYTEVIYMKIQDRLVILKGESRLLPVEIPANKVILQEVNQNFLSICINDSSRITFDSYDCALSSEVLDSALIHSGTYNKTKKVLEISVFRLIHSLDDFLVNLKIPRAFYDGKYQCGPARSPIN